MNDFTKEELEIIFLDMKFYAEQKMIRGLQESPIHIELKEKIQSMIDTHCEHEEESKVIE